MKIAQSAIVVVVLGILTAVNAAAQNAPLPTTPESVQPTSLDSGSSFVLVSDDANNAPAKDAKDSAAASGSADEEEKPSCRLCRSGKLADAWTLPQPDCLKDRKITVGGWLEGGIYGNQWGAASNGPIGFRNVGDGMTADQLWMFGERKTDTQGCGWDLGGRVDYLFGADGPDTQAFGDHTWDYGWNSARDYGSAIPQAYVEVAYNNLTVKGGRFFTLIGYEVVPATQNFFYSHSYSMYFAEPFTHTGMLAAYKCNDKVTLNGGWVNGWDEGWEGKNKGSQFLGGVTLKLSEKTTLTWATTSGSIGTGEAFDGAAEGDVYMNSLVLNCVLSDKWTYVFQHDLGTNYNIGDANNQWYGVSNYLIRKINDCWAFAGRAEWFQDPQGARVSGGASPGNYFEITGGFNYKPHANLTIRPELRYDWFNGIDGATAEPFNDGTASTQLSGGFDVIFTF